MVTATPVCPKDSTRSTWAWYLSYSDGRKGRTDNPFTPETDTGREWIAGNTTGLRHTVEITRAEGRVVAASINTWSPRHVAVRQLLLDVRVAIALFSANMTRAALAQAEGEGK